MMRARGSSGIAVLCMLLAACTGGEPAEPDEGARTGEQVTGAADDQGAAATASASPDAASGDAASATEEELPLGEPKWVHAAPMLSGPVEADGLVLAYVASDESLDAVDLKLVGIDPSTGEQAWSAAASPSTLRTLEEPAVVGATVMTAVGSGDGEWADLVVRAVADGGQVARSADPVALAWGPYPCDDQDEGFCFSGWLPGADEMTDYRAVVDGEDVTISEDQTGDAEEHHLIGVVGPYAGSEDPDVFRGYQDGELLWELPAAEAGLEVSEHETVLGSYSGSAEGDMDGVYQYDVFLGPEQEPGEELRLPLAEHRHIGIDEATGDVLWSEPQTSGCPGGSATDGVVVVCTGAGDAVVTPDGQIEYDAEDVELRGLDDRTGEELWSVDITAADWTAMERLPVTLDDSIVHVQVDGERTLLHGRSGEEVDRADVSYDCWEFIPWTSSVDDGEAAREGASMSFACLLDGAPTDPPTWESAERLGVTVGDLVVTATPEGLQAYRIPGS